MGETGLNQVSGTMTRPSGAASRVIRSVLAPASTLTGMPTKILISLVDATGLAVTGSWIQAPRFNLDDWSIGWPSFVVPHITKFGDLKVLRFPDSISGHVNIDVHCMDGCNLWDVHSRVDLDHR
jgi:hypothetical protein